MEIDAQDDLFDALIKSGSHPSIDKQDQAILNYAMKLTRNPATIDQTDMLSLRDAGLDDRGLHDLCAITAYFAFVNRMADGLGVELEDRFGDI